MNRTVKFEEFIDEIDETVSVNKVEEDEYQISIGDLTFYPNGHSVRKIIKVFNKALKEEL